MPTGYTAKLHDGDQPFDEFALDCARAFGALILMRDDPPDARIPDRFEPSSYHAEKLAEARTERARFEAMTDEEASAEASESYQGELADFEADKVSQAAMRSRYQQMLAEVEAWQPPTEEHQGLKEFMANQLTDSMRFDLSEPRPPVLATATEWKRNGLAQAQRDIEYHTAEQAREVERAEQRTAWVRALRASLPGPWDRVTPDPNYSCTEWIPGTGICDEVPTWSHRASSGRFACDKHVPAGVAETAAV